MTGPDTVEISADTAAAIRRLVRHHADTLQGEAAAERSYASSAERDGRYRDADSSRERASRLAYQAGAWQSIVDMLDRALGSQPDTNQTALLLEGVAS